MKTSITQHHCDSSCASESFAFLKQENNFYTRSCNYFQAFYYFNAFVIFNRLHIVLNISSIILYLVIPLLVLSFYPLFLPFSSSVNTQWGGTTGS